MSNLVISKKFELQHFMFSLKNIRAFFHTVTNKEYGYLDDDAFFNQLRRNEFSRLDKLQHVYLDYTGGCLYP